MTAAFTKSLVVRQHGLHGQRRILKEGSMYRTVVAATLTLLIVVVGFALFVPVASAQSAECNDDNPCPPPCGGEGQPPCNICHNIGGPRELGANCDATGCSVDLGGGQTLTVLPGQFLGIIIGKGTVNALAAHIAHGDGPILVTFNPPLHLASTGQQHKAANVECVGQRLVPQPPDHGN
jgi:hypothetical protein